MAEVIERRATIAEAAHRLAPAKRYWAVVGNGVNRIAAAEVRIKLSELCYKSIASDSTEDKKHIDLSSEPLILVCAAGLEGSTADDVAKEVAIYRAHKASPIVIATDGQSRFASALHVLPVPATHPALAFVLSSMAGHLFGYEAALAIDGARPGRCARPGGHRGGSCRRGIVPAARPAGPDDTMVLSHDGEHDAAAPRAPTSNRWPAATSTACGSVRYDGQLEASTAVRLAALLRYVLGVLPLDAYQLDQGKVGTPAVVIDDLTGAAHPGHRGADPPGRRHQAPGQDRHRRHLAQRRDAARGAARARGDRHRRAPRPAHLPHAAHAGRHQPRRRGGGRRYPLPHRGPRSASRAPPRSRSSTAAASLATCPAAPTGRPSCGAPRPGWPASASCSSPAAVATGARS